MIEKVESPDDSRVMSSSLAFFMVFSSGIAPSEMMIAESSSKAATATIFVWAWSVTHTAVRSA